MKKIFRKLIKWIFLAYIAYATLIGTTVLIWPYIVLLYNGTMAPAPFPVYLANGFIYDRDENSVHGTPKLIKDKNNNIIIMSNVVDIMWYKDTIYGYRRGLAKEPYYYICTYGEDCLDTQHLKEVDFIKMLQDKNLPPYDSSVAQTYDQLLWEQSKTDIGKKGG